MAPVQSRRVAIALGRPAGSRFDWRGLESLPFDMETYLRRLGPSAARRSFATFADATRAQDPFGPTGVLGYLSDSPAFQATRAHPATPPDMSDFVQARAAYLDIFTTVMDANRLDALVFPQLRAPPPPLHSDATIEATTVSEINIAGLPGVVVPAGTHQNGAPFCPLFVGRQWSAAHLLALAFDYEHATRHRRAPALIA